MSLFKAVQFDIQTCEPTGWESLFQAENITQAVLKCLYVERLDNSRASISPHNDKIVYNHMRGYAFVIKKDCSKQ